MQNLLEKDYLLKRIPEREYIERANKIRRALNEEGLEVGIAYATEHMPGDVQYLTGYDPHLENVALLVTPDRVIGLEAPKVQKCSRTARALENGAI